MDNVSRKMLFGTWDQERLISTNYLESSKFCLQNTAKGEYQIYPRMDLDNIFYFEYLSHNNYKIKYYFISRKLLGHMGHLDVHPLCDNVWSINH